MDTLDELAIQNAARNFIIDPKGVLGPLFFATELGGEVGEALNIVKKLERKKLPLLGNFSTANIEQLGEELADVIICVSLLANLYSINLSAEVRRKFNLTSTKINVTTRMGEPS